MHQASSEGQNTATQHLPLAWGFHQNLIKAFACITKAGHGDLTWENGSEPPLEIIFKRDMAHEIEKGATVAGLLKLHVGEEKTFLEAGSALAAPSFCANTELFCHYNVESFLHLLLINGAV